MKSALYLITTEYPYGTSETFIENEIKILAKRFDKVYLLPLSKGNGKCREYPSTVSILDTFTNCRLPRVSVNIFRRFGYILKLLMMELLHTNKKKYFVKNVKSMIGIISSGISKAECLKKELNVNPLVKNYYYSFWMNEGAFILSVLKDEKLIDDFVFRVLGYDLYDERRDGGYMPFRYINFKMTSRVICISQDGVNYLVKKNLFPDKLTLSYLSVYDNGNAPLAKPVEFTLVSCSNLIPLKRIHLIIEALKKVTIPVTWIHFGGGVLEKELNNQLKLLPANIHPELKGQTSNSEIIEFYRNNFVNLFIHLSETEGGAPVALQEAASFGIPLIGTDAGGISEIITGETGVLLPADVDVERVAAIINNFNSDKMNTMEFRQQVKAYWYKNFNAEINYNQLCDMILSGKFTTI